jgi:beta-barrel assembly-enhancing protease
MSGQSVFTGTYYDGRTARPFSARAIPAQEGLRILLEGENVSEIIWDYHKIHRNPVNNNKIVLKYGDFPSETLELGSEAFLKAASRYAPDARFLILPYRGYLRIGSAGILIGVAGIIGLLLGLYFFLIPALMNFAADRFPRSLEYEMGQSMKGTFISSAQVDRERTRDINRFFGLLKADTRYKINITVIKSGVKNAFALPGGEIVVFSAILDTMETYHELAALLGHELGHIEKRHTLKLLFRNLSTYILVSALLQDVSGVMAVIVDNAARLNGLSYNRKAEKESDEYGFALMQKNHLRLTGMTSLFEKLKAGDGHEGEVPEFLATHPSLGRRIETVNSWIAGQTDNSKHHPGLDHYWQLLRKKH